MKVSTKNKRVFESLDPHEQWSLKADSFFIDLVVQLHQLREKRGLTQAQLADLVGTKQQVISRMESPGYDRHNLSTLRRVAEKLGAFVDVVLVPEEKYEGYLDWRYQPVLMEASPRSTQYEEDVVVESSFCSEQTITSVQVKFEKFPDAHWPRGGFTTYYWKEDQTAPREKKAVA
ncbi:MAG: helix-turn-helix transcriptional regulator [Chloroflexi bacterium]|nr:helix-turn-helix transcriptional regulator [Chloroflexota bacterium]